MKRITLLDFDKNRTRKTKRWLGLLTSCMMIFVGQMSFAQLLNESFDNTSLPTGWTQEYVSGTTNWATVTANGNSTITPHTGSRMAEFRVAVEGPATKLITPSLDLTTLTSPLLTFYYANVNWLGDIDELRVFYKTSSTGDWVQIGEDYVDEKTSWEKVELVLPNPSADYYIAFEATSEWARGLNLDDVTIGEAPSCMVPTVLTATDITASSASLGWTAAGTLFDVEYGTSGFTPTGNPTDATTTGVANPFTLGGLTPETTYEYYVRQDCGVDGFSTWTGPFSFTTAIACPAPTALTATNITTDSADLGWTSTGTLFDVEYGEAGFTPTGNPTDATTTGVANPFTLGGLTDNTQYQYYVRQDCGVDGFSVWVGPFNFSTECIPPSITGTTPGEVCGEGMVELSATADVGASIGWYAAQTGGTQLAEGEDFTTPSITETTSYWVAAYTGTSGNGARLAPNYTSGAYTTAINYGLVFTATESFVLNTVDVYLVGTAGNLVVNLTNATGTVLQTETIALPALGTTSAPVQHTITLDFDIEPGSYRLLAQSSPNMVRETTGITYPYAVEDVASITSGYISGNTASTYYYFYNWAYTAGCYSTRTEVVATVTNAPDFALSGTDATICEGETTSAVTITAGDADYDTYVWNPATGVSGNATTGWVFNPTETTTYTLTVSQVSGEECTTTAMFTVTVNSLPTAITVVASQDEACENSVVELSVTGNVVDGTAVFGEGTTAPGATSWPNPFSKWYGGTKHQMLFTSDELSSQGLIAGSKITAVTFDIAAINTSANNVCTNFTIRMGATSVTEMTGFVSGTIDVYGPSSFTPTTTGIVTFDLTTAYVWDGLSNIVVETVHNTGNGGGGSGTNTRATTTTNNSVYRAAKDDVAGGIAGFDADNFTTGTYAVGSNNLRPNMTFIHSIEQNLITWSPAINLYTDVEATIAYVADMYATTVYFKSSSVGDFTYTATSYTDAGCNISDDVEIAVNEAPEAPVTACYEIATFNPATCQWDITGEQPEQPAITCYETATFNDVTCEWDITGDQPEEPVLACYETATFNDATCQWDITGEEPEQPVLACYETAEFNVVTCEWDVTGDQPEQPILACYETAEFNAVTCEWDITGTAPATPTADSPQTLSEDQTVADIVVTDVTGTLNWYDADGNVVDDSTILSEGTYTFYVSQTIEGCESDTVQVDVEVTLSTKGFDNASFRAYPNPIKDFFNVSYSKDITNVSVVNMLGQTVIIQTVNAADVQIDMTGLPTGSYFVKVTADGAVKTVKVIKQ